MERVSVYFLFYSLNLSFKQGAIDQIIGSLIQMDMSFSVCDETSKIVNNNLWFFCFAIARYYINYKMMKKRVKHYVQQTETGGKNREQVLKEFSRMLDDQVQIK